MSRRSSESFDYVEPLPAGTCALCSRPFGLDIERHHLVPKTFKGKETVDVHPVCHRKIHSVLSERELARSYNTVKALLAHPDIATFVAWVSGKDPDFYVSSHNSNERKKRG